MARLEFENVAAKHFHTFNNLDFDFKTGRHLIVGEDLTTGSSNGSGKSSMMEVTTWTIYKRYPRGTDPSTHGKGNCATSLSLKVDGIPHRIERGLKMAKGGSYVKLYREEMDISARTAPEIETQIEKLIGIPYDLWISSVVVHQGLPISFTSFTPNLRKSVFESILGFSIWDSYKGKVDKKFKVVLGELGDLQTKYATKEREMVGLNSKIETLQEAQAREVTDATAKLAGYKSQIDEAATVVLRLSDEMGAIYGNKSIDQIVEQHGDAKAKASNLFTTLNSHKSFLKTGVCPTCKTPYAKDKIHNAEEEVTNLTRLLGEAEAASAAFGELSARAQTKYRELQDSHNKLKLLKRQFSDAQAETARKSESVDIQALQTQLDTINADVNDLHEQIASVEKEKGRYEYLSQLLMPSSQFRTKVLDDYIQIVSNIIETVSPVLFQNVTIRLSINDKATGIDINVFKGQDEIDYKQLSGGEKRRLDVIIILSIQKFLLEASGIRTNLLSFDELFEGLDSTGVDAVVNALEFMFEDGLCMYVISHNDSLKQRFDSIISVVKEFGVSRVMQ